MSFSVAGLVVVILESGEHGARQFHIRFFVDDFHGDRVFFRLILD